MNYTREQLKKHEDYIFLLGKRFGARIKPAELIGQLNETYKFVVTRMTSKDVQQVIEIDAYSLIKSNFSLYSYQKTKKNIKLTKEIIEKKFGIKCEVATRNFGGYKHNCIRFTYKKKLYDFIYIDESYYLDGETNNKYPVFWKYKIDHRKIDSNYRDIYIEGLISSHILKNK